MTFVDSAQSPEGYFTPGGPARVTVHPRGQPSGDPFEGDLDAPPKTAVKAPTQQAGDPFAGDLDQAPPPAPTASELSGKTFGGAQTAMEGAAKGATFGAMPAIRGLAEAAGPEHQVTFATTNGGTTTVPTPMAPVVGAAKMLGSWLSDHPDPEVQKAYQRGREQGLNDQNAAQEQHPWAFGAGQLAAILAMPGMGAMQPAALGGRLIQGARAGAAFGGLEGVGEGLSENQSVGDIAKRAATGAGVGAATGAAIGGAIGPRIPVTPGAGQRAAQTAESLGETLPKGVVSDSGIVQRTAAATSSAPIFGARMGGQIQRTGEAAGKAISQSGVQDAIDANKAAIDALYDNVRNQIDPNLVMPMPRTQAALQRVRQRRIAARQPNPDQGLEQFDNLANQGASFNGAHRARMDAREAGDPLNPHPGYNAADYNEIVRAITGDMRGNIYQMGQSRMWPNRTTGQAAVRAFDEAESRFGPMADANRYLRRMLDRHGQDADLSALGLNKDGDFSLDRFVTNWSKLNPDARPFIPTAAHARNIEDIFEMGQQIKRVMGNRNTSHTSNVLILWDLARDAAMTGVGVATGVVTVGGAAGAAAGAAPAIVFMHWLASPAHAASMSAWSRAYTALGMSPTPARIAAFKIATRNLGNTLGIPAENILAAAQRRLLPTSADEQNEQ